MPGVRPAGDTGCVRILLISGSLRARSTNTAVLRTVRSIAPTNVELELFDGVGGLPHFNPDDDVEGAPPAPVAVLRSRIAAADAVLFSTPEYAGALPGSFKNLLEWTVGGTEISDKPVAWINVASVAAPTGGADAHDSLRKVLGYISADIVEAACARLPVAGGAVNAAGTIEDPAVRTGLRASLDALVDHVANRPD